MQGLKIFKNKEFGVLRTHTENNEVWFVGKEVAEQLGYSNQNRDIVRHVDEDDRRMIETQYLDGIELGQRGGWLINESGLYSLVLSSKLPDAKKFKRWVTSEVLPSIRKNGGYIANQENLSAEQIIANALIIAQKVIDDKTLQLERAEQHIEETKPLVVFAESVQVSRTNILVGELAKLIKQSTGADLGQQRMFVWLRDNGYLHKGGEQYNLPTQKSVDMNLIKIKEGSRIDHNGVSHLTRTPVVTGKGQVYFLNKIKNEVENEC